MTTPTGAVKTLLERVSDLDRLLKNDNVWAPLADEVLTQKESAFQKEFWLALEGEIRGREGRIGLCHKGQIYWRLALLSLGSGVLSESIEYLEKGVVEDKRRGDDFSASIGLQSILKPLIYRYKGSAWKFDETIMDFYESLSVAERSEFADALFRTHDLVGAGAVNVIKQEFFSFIQDKEVRKVAEAGYREVLNILGGPPLPTYYSSFFCAGSILEGMLDDLLSRDSHKIWRLFRDNAEVMKHINDSRLRKNDFDSSMTLGQKIFVLRALAIHAKSPVARPAVLLMLIIAEYRDLIHPRRRLDFQFEANAYVARFIFTLLSQVAGHWWPKNIEAQLGNDGS